MSHSPTLNNIHLRLFVHQELTWIFIFFQDWVFTKCSNRLRNPLETFNLCGIKSNTHCYEGLLFLMRNKKIEVDVEIWQKPKQLKWWIDFCCTFVKKKNYEIQVIKR